MKTVKLFVVVAILSVGVGLAHGQDIHRGKTGPGNAQGKPARTPLPTQDKRTGPAPGNAQGTPARTPLPAQNKKVEWVPGNAQGKRGQKPNPRHAQHKIGGRGRHASDATQTLPTPTQDKTGGQGRDACDATQADPTPTQDKTGGQGRDACDATQALPMPTQDETGGQGGDASEAVPAGNTESSPSMGTPAQSGNGSTTEKTSTPMASIDGLTAERVDGNTVHIVGKVSSNSPPGGSKVTWSLLYLDSTGWRQVKGGTLSFKRASYAKKNCTEGIDLKLGREDLSNSDLAAEQKFRLMVTPSQQGFLETKLDTVRTRNPGVRR